MLDKIDRFGWMVQVVAGDADHPPFAYTIGAATKLSGLLPGELLLVGFEDIDEACRVLNWIVKRVAETERPLELGLSDEVFAAGVPAHLGEVRAEFVIAEWFGAGMWFSRIFDAEAPYRAIQVVWPTSSSRRFPWQIPLDDPSRDWVMKTQPLLCDSPNPSRLTGK
jgi:hypothetical protein